MINLEYRKYDYFVNIFKIPKEERIPYRYTKTIWKVIVNMFT